MNQENRYIYRIQYTKGESVKYISHLDFLRCVNRSFKRAKLPVAYSKGFNPHILLNIALPCPVGVSSECELLDIELKDAMDCELIKTSLSASLPFGIQVLEVKNREGEADFFDISSAKYHIEFKSDRHIDIEKFADQKEIIIEKKSKRGMKEVNLKDFIREIKLVSASDKSYEIEAVIDAGAKSNLKSELMIKAMENYFSAVFTDIKQHRLEIYFS